MKRARGSWGELAGRRASDGATVGARRWFRPRLELLEQRFLLSIVPAAPQIFYDHSSFDGNVPGISTSDDHAIAPDKSAYLPTGSAATFANVSSYSRGINGVMLDLSGAHGTITANDFTFKVGNNNSPAGWGPAPAPAAITVRAGAGAGGADRVEIVWSDPGIQKEWLEGILAANANTGLSQSYAFFVGNAVGDAGVAESGGFSVTSSDEISARNDPHGALNLASISNVNDFDRDAQVTSSDQIIARNNGTGAFDQLQVLTVSLNEPTLAAALAHDTAPDGQTNSDGITSDVTIGGTLADVYQVTSFKAGLNGGPVTTDCMGLLQSNGSFTVSPNFLTAMNGGTLPDGPYTLRLQSVDAQGLSTATVVSFVKKTSIAVPQAPDLVDASDTGASNTDNVTNDNTPTFLVTAENGAQVKLLVDNVVLDQGTASPTAQLTASTLADGTRAVKVMAQDVAGNTATSAALLVTIGTSAPAVSAATMAAFTDDVTPHVTVTASSANASLLPNTTQINFDVDLNFDGDFDDPGETNRTQATLYNQAAFFQVTPAIPAPISTSTYVEYRARVTDLAGNVGTSPVHSLRIDNAGNNFLSSYVNDPSSPYSYDTPTITTDSGSGFTAYVYKFTSQTWRTTADVDRTEWDHWLTIIVPTADPANLSSTALLMIDSGSNNDPRPTTVNSNLAKIAKTLNTVVIDLRMVPNQPLTFTDDPNHVARTEDQVLAYSFNEFEKEMGVGPDWTSWPALLPMVKSVKRAMDMVQAVDTGLTGGKDISDFVITGYSKRGWTTWLTAAVDNRIKAIIPGVIDVLNMDEQMMHHHEFYDGETGSTFDDGFSVAIQDYVGYGIPENVQMPKGQELGRVVDPYRYLNNGNFNIPKLLLNASQDEFFVPDSSQFYFSDLPGTQNYLRYVPNSGHNIDSTATTNSTLTFMNAVIKNLQLPQYSWTVQPDGSLRVQTSSSPTQVLLWQETNPNARDFRKTFNPTLSYSSSPLVDQGGGVYVANVAPPATGATAFFIELTFTSPLGGNPYVFTTEIRVVSNTPLGTWSYYTEPYVNGPMTLPAAAAAAATPQSSASGQGVNGENATTGAASSAAVANLNGVASSMSPTAISQPVATWGPAPGSASAATSQPGDSVEPSSSLDDLLELDSSDDEDRWTLDDPAAIDVALADLDPGALD